MGRQYTRPSATGLLPGSFTSDFAFAAAARRLHRDDAV
jgi:hypothetical protein